jgi:hypothetical protein
VKSWFLDPRVIAAEVAVHEAEMAERRGDRNRAVELYLEAAQALVEVAMEVPDDFPNTKRDIGLAAAGCRERVARLRGLVPKT